jgi:hypothetical protein
MPKRRKQKVFGLGLSKTGTTSLHHAFEKLGLRSAHYPVKPDLLQARFDCFDDFDAYGDTPVVSYYREIDAAYPGSKFILTVREVDAWLRSMKRLLGLERMLKPFAWHMLSVVYGVHQFHEERLRRVYEHHVRDVQGYFEGRPGDLLVLDITAGEGWEKLCPFLGRPVPRAPFPHSASPGSEPRAAAAP